MRFIALFVAIFLWTASASAQKSATIWASLQTNYSPVFQLNNQHFSEVRSVGLKLSFYDRSIIPAGVEFYFASRYHSSVDFSYGIGFVYIVLEKQTYRFKVGLNGGRIKMNDFEYNLEVGGILEDELHEIIHPYVEWEWLFSEYASIYFKAGYRFLRSETMMIFKKLDEKKIGNRTETIFKGRTDTRL